jgi:hypothetical protein
MNKLFRADDKLADFIDRHAGIVLAALLLLSMLMDSFA